MQASINRRVLVSGTQYFHVKELNPYSRDTVQPNLLKAANELDFIKSSFEQIGISVKQVDAPPNCQDGVYTANWGLCRNNLVVLSSLPNARKSEEVYAQEALKRLGKKTIKAPYRFSGQGDALPCGNLLFVGSNYRTDFRMHEFLSNKLGYEVIGLRTIPELDNFGKPINNKVTGWPDSFFYDLDLALAVISPHLIAWCPEAFLPESQAKIKALTLDKIEVSIKEAKQGFACNLVSSGKAVIMSNHAPQLKQALISRGFTVITPGVTELLKGGGYIRCVSLTLDNI